MPADRNQRPLYDRARDARLISTTVGNAGLWYDKFCDRWNAGWNSLGDGGKRDWIATIANLDGSAAKRLGDRELLDEAVVRQADLVRMRGGKTLQLATVWRFASGLGRSHPVENGFAWHHVLGAPYLPGSGVKGVARAWAVWSGFAASDIERIFGPQQSGGIGSAIFLDALPVKPVALDADVMTPHYAPWYHKGEAQAPGDWHSPTPIPFLTVARGQTFQFALLPRTPDAAADCNHAAELLQEALATLGAGAKTAAGYGVFGPQSDKGPVAEETSQFASTKASADLPSGELRSVLLERRTKKGGWMGRHLETGIEGPIQGVAPSDCKPGDEVTLIRANRTDFKWPTGEDRQRLSHPEKPSRKPGGKPSRKGSRKDGR
jgi:CRISPR-associated protein Cmr6